MVVQSMMAGRSKVLPTFAGIASQRGQISPALADYLPSDACTGRLRILAGGIALVAVSFGLLFVPQALADVRADQYASDSRGEAAVGHYSRARALLVEALAEFEQGRRFARPDLLLDSERWRLTAITLTEQLNRVIDPKPRITREGVRFRAQPRLIRRTSEQLPVVADGAKGSNIYGEIEFRQKREAEKAAAMAESSAEEKPAVEADDSGRARLKAPEETIDQQPAEQPVSEEETIVTDDEMSEELDNGEQATELAEDEEITKAIEEAIQERLRSIEEQGPGTENPAEIEFQEEEQELEVQAGG